MIDFLSYAGFSFVGWPRDRGSELLGGLFCLRLSTLVREMNGEKFLLEKTSRELDYFLLTSSFLVQAVSPPNS